MLIYRYMHNVQSHILKKLSFVDKARYADLKPGGAESNLFVYHLKSLIRSGYITKKDDAYLLTHEGKRYISRLSLETFKERIQPKIVTIIVIEHEGEYLLYRRRNAPFRGMTGFPYGKIHLEERILDAANRELFEKTNLKADLKHRGDTYITVHDEDELVAHMLCHVFEGKNPRGILKGDTVIGDCFWQNIEDIQANNLIPGVKQILKDLKKHKKFFFSEYFLNTTG
jgi:ADP-ribose pyrophosphatase YjhB (NUDIX family)